MRNLYQELSKFDANYWLWVDTALERALQEKIKKLGGFKEIYNYICANLPHRHTAVVLPAGVNGNITVVCAVEPDTMGGDLTLDVQCWDNDTNLWTSSIKLTNKGGRVFSTNCSNAKATTYAEEQYFSKIVVDTMVAFCIALTLKDYRIGSQDRTYFNKTKKQKIRKSVTLTYVSNKRYIGTPKALGGPKVQWNHSWQVRGHWRRNVNGLGKSRDGCRAEVGRTWVVPYKKQTQLEYKNKQRIIK